jgi:hypothetical protein
MPAAAGNDAAPILGILFELVSLEGVNLVADDAHDFHWQSFGSQSGERFAAAAQRSNGRRDTSNGIAATRLLGGGVTRD